MKSSEEGLVPSHLTAVSAVTFISDSPAQRTVFSSLQAFASPRPHYKQPAGVGSQHRKLVKKEDCEAPAQTHQKRGSSPTTEFSQPQGPEAPRLERRRTSGGKLCRMLVSSPGWLSAHSGQHGSISGGQCPWQLLARAVTQNRSRHQLESSASHFASHTIPSGVLSSP